jgi:hypothetical protein
VPRRSASPSSISPPKELQPLAWNHRRRRRFLARNRPSLPPNSSSPAILRRGRPPRRFPGELPVRPPPSLLLFPRRSHRHGRPPAVPGSRSAGQRPRPTWPGWPTMWPSGPLSQSLRVSLTPVQKVSACLFYFRKLQKNVQSYKMHRKLSACRKIANDLPKCSEKHALCVYVKLMHC